MEKATPSLHSKSLPNPRVELSYFSGQTGAGKTYTMMGDFEESNTDVTSYLTVRNLIGII